MKKILNILSLTLAAVLIMTGCQMDEPELDKMLQSSTLQFEITQNPDDPNMVILESLTPDVIPMWVTPMGRSTKVKDTVRLPFAGTYNFIYNVSAGGGFVAGDTTTLEITTMNLSYVDDPLWNTLTGGVGESKTWLLDLDAEGQSKYFLGPMYFSGDVWRWDNTCSEEGDKCWIWEADWPSNGWIAAANDYGTMTFSLEGGAFIHVDHQNTPGRGEENGTFFLDADAKTLSLTDAAPLMNDWVDGANIADWSKGYLISLTDEAMQIGYKDKGKEEFIIFNYISKEYSDNWVPADTPDPVPPYDGDGNGDLTTNTSTSKTWSVDIAYPYNWHDLGGVALNEVATYGTDPAGFAFTTWAPPYDADAFGAISMALTKTGDAEGTYAITTATDSYEGTYTVNENNEIDFGQSITFFSGVGGWLTFGTTAENTLRILMAEETAGAVTGIWLGQKAADKPEYLSIHLKATGGGSGGSDPEDALKEILMANPWKLDSDRTYDIETTWGNEQGPVIFSDFATWSWNPLPGEHYAAGETDVDYGSMTFLANGTVEIQQRKRIYTYEEGGETLVRDGMPDAADVLSSDEVVTLTGIWALDVDNNKLRISVPMLHPWTCDYAVVDWGDLTIQRAEDGVLILKALRDADLSGEDEFLMAYVFVPGE
ncbi:hypothetical protein [Marinoscillum pacificum]|uniref:hypothetical protein n=1 Tax=Marinoscillum pacificum TaxID=392723 RepID=UPI002157C204|nr:hypothetical protein [Marinoscillum pacificum]